MDAGWPRLAPSDPCPCGRTAAAGSGKGKVRAFGDCCGRFVGPLADEGGAAPDAESLMRSRYTAFVLGDAGYLLATWHPDTRPETLALDPAQQWLGLQVKAHLPRDATHAEVAFVARSRDATGRASRLVEHSRFVREGGRWYYVDGRLGG